MSKTAIVLVRELAKRFNEYIPALAFSGTTSTLVANRCNVYFPADITPLNAWFYGPLALVTDTVNRGLEPRASTWTASTSTFTFPSGFVWATAPTNSELYDCHLKYEHTRLLAAINDGIGELGLMCARPVIDTSLTTAANTFTYTLPSSVNWSKVDKVQIQSNTDATLTGYPYTDADAYGYEIQRSRSSAGVDVWIIQFRSQPQASRTLKVFGEAYYPALSADTDVLAIGGEIEGRVYRWVMDWAAYVMNDWTAEGVPQSEVAAFRQKAYDKLQYAMQELKDYAHPAQNQRIVTPMNDGTLRPGQRSGYFGAFTPH